MNIFQTGMNRKDSSSPPQAELLPSPWPYGRPFPNVGAFRKLCLFIFILFLLQNDLRSLLCLSTVSSWDAPQHAVVRWFLSHTNLEPERLRNDCRHYKLRCSTPPPPPVFSAGIFPHYLLHPSFSSSLLHLYLCPYHMPNYFLILFFPLLPGLKQLRNWLTQISTNCPCILDKSQESWNEINISYSYIELWVASAHNHLSQSLL